MTQTRQLAAIMFTDIVGYTALMGKDSSKALELVNLSREIQKPLVEKYNGQWLKEMGDGALAKFLTALDAVNCAIDIQRASRADFEGDLRIGIHLGDVTIAEQDVYGDGVNIASRLQAIADPGGIYISESIEKAIRGQSKVQAKYLGEIQLKNVDYDVRTYSIQGVGLPIPEVKDEKELSGHLWAEIQRRDLARVAISYLVVGMLIVLLLRQVQDWGINIPAWSMTALLTLLAVGFPLALFLAWNYERSPTGFVKTTSEKSWRNPYTVGQRKPLTNNFVIIIMIVMLMVMYIYPKFGANPRVNDKVVVSDKSIAVLPFRNDTPNQENDFFGNGMLEELLDKLHKVGELNVISRTAVEGYRNTSKDPKDIAGELGVDNIVEGSVRMYQNRFRVTVQLIHASTGYHLWSEVFDGTLSDTVFVVQSRIATIIADKLNASITPFEQQQISKNKTSNYSAYEKYIKGKDALKDYWNGNREQWKVAISLFQEAVDTDPEFASGYVGLCELYNSVGPVQSYDSVNYYADKILQLDPHNGWGYLFKGNVLSNRGDQVQALDYFEKAVELDPKHPFFHERLGRFHCEIQNSFTKGIPFFERARDLYSIQKWTNLELFYRTLGRTFYLIGDYSRAKQYFETAVDLGDACRDINDLAWLVRYESGEQAAFNLLDSEINDTSSCKEFVHIWKFYHSIESKNFDKARIFLNAHLETGGQLGLFDSTSLAYLELQIGSEKKAMEILDKVQAFFVRQLETDKERWWINLGLSEIHAMKGQNKEALNCIERAAEKGVRGWHIGLTEWPTYESLWNDPEFKAIIKRVHDEQAALRKQVDDLQEKEGLDLMPL